MSFGFGKWVSAAVFCLVLAGVGFVGVSAAHAAVSGTVSGSRTLAYDEPAPVLLAAGGLGEEGDSCGDTCANDPNDTCVPDTVCDSSLGLSCQSGTCQSNAASGGGTVAAGQPCDADTCNDGFQCGPGLTCNGTASCEGDQGSFDGTCVAAGGATPTWGSSCESNSDCGAPASHLFCESDSTCAGDGSIGASCDSEGDADCQSGTCSPSGLCVAGAGDNSLCTKSSECSTGDACDLGLENPYCTPVLGDGSVGAVCLTSDDCTSGFMCGPTSDECTGTSCSSRNVGSSCGMPGETCQNLASTGAVDCAPPNGAGGSNRSPGQSTGGKNGAGGGGGGSKTGAGTTTTMQCPVPAGCQITKNPDGTITVVNPTTGSSTTYPAGSVVSPNPTTGVVTVTTPPTSAGSPGSTSGLGVKPGVCDAGLGGFDGISLFPKICNFNDFIVAAVNIMLSVLAVIAAFFVILGGFKYVTANGDSESAKKGLETVKDAAIGLAIAILAYAIIAVVVNTASSLGPASSSSSSSTTNTSSSGAAPG